MPTTLLAGDAPDFRVMHFSELPETNGQLEDSFFQTCDPIGNWFYSGITKSHFREFEFAA